MTFFKAVLGLAACLFLLLLVSFLVSKGYEVQEKISQFLSAFAGGA